MTTIQAITNPKTQSSESSSIRWVGFDFNRLGVGKTRKLGRVDDASWTAKGYDDPFKGAFEDMEPTGWIIPWFLGWSGSDHSTSRQQDLPFSFGRTMDPTITLEYQEDPGDLLDSKEDSIRSKRSYDLFKCTGVPVALQVRSTLGLNWNWSLECERSSTKKTKTNNIPNRLTRIQPTSINPIQTRTTRTQTNPTTFNPINPTVRTQATPTHHDDEQQATQSTQPTLEDLSPPYPTHDDHLTKRIRSPLWKRMIHVERVSFKEVYLL